MLTSTGSWSGPKQGSTQAAVIVLTAKVAEDRQIFCPDLPEAQRMPEGNLVRTAAWEAVVPTGAHPVFWGRP